jgi:predicted ABC-type ATPase
MTEKRVSKQVVIVAGANGSGKTTFAHQFAERVGYQYLCADEIAVRLAPDKFNEVKIQAGREFFKQLADLITANKNFVIESTLSGLGFQRIMHRLNQARYTITILFVYLETAEVCVKRIKERVLKGGHHVPEVDVKRRFHRSPNNFWHHYKNKAHYWHIFYNASDGFIEVAAGKGDQFSITDETLFKLFLAQVISYG